MYVSEQQHEWVSSFVRLSPFTEQRVPRFLEECNASTEAAFESYRSDIETSFCLTLRYPSRNLVLIVSISCQNKRSDSLAQKCPYYKSSTSNFVVPSKQAVDLQIEYKRLVLFQPATVTTVKLWFTRVSECQYIRL